MGKAKEKSTVECSLPSGQRVQFFIAFWRFCLYISAKHNKKCKKMILRTNNFLDTFFFLLSIKNHNFSAPFAYLRRIVDRPICVLYMHSLCLVINYKKINAGHCKRQHSQLEYARNDVVGQIPSFFREVRPQRV